MKLFRINKEIYTCSASEQSLFKTTLIALLLGLIYPIINDGSVLSMLISLLSTMLSLLAIYMFYSMASRPKQSGSVSFFVVVAVYMFILGLLGGGFTIDKTHLMMVITNDLRYVSLFWLGGLFASSTKYMAMFHKLVITTAKWAVALSIVGLIVWAGRGFAIMRGAEDTSLFYHLSWAPGVCFVYCGYQGLINKENRKLFVLLLVLYFIMQMAFLKRAAFVDIIVIISLSVYFMSSLGKTNRSSGNFALIILVLVAVSVFIVGSNPISSALFSRFSDAAEDVDSFDRMIEWQIYQDNTTTFDRLRGFGIGKYLYYDRYGTGREETFLNALHFGYANIIYKGGLLYALFYIVTYIKVFANWFRNRKRLTPLYIVCFGVSISALISLLYEGSWTYTIDPFFIAAPIFYAAEYSDK